MNAGTWFWLLTTAIVALNTIAQSLLKMGAGKGLINAPLAGGIVAYGLSTLLYVLVLGRHSLSFAYPVIIGATAIATCVVSGRFLGERLGGVQWMGIALIVAGIACVARGRGV